MPITINGSGTVTGISAGGLPDGCIETADLASTVPVAKAWVNFNGTGAVAIRASYNVSSITDNGVGDYTVNFTTAMVDENYATSTTTGNSAASGPGSGLNNAATAPTASAVRVIAFNDVATRVDQSIYNVAIFR